MFFFRLYYKLQVEFRKKSRLELLGKSGVNAADMEDIVDEEEFQLMKELREAKRAYKNSFEQLQKHKVSSAVLSSTVDAMKKDLVSSYNNWSMKGVDNLNRRATQQTYLADGEKDSDSLDDQEAFDRMEEDRVLASDPDSLAFFHAQKTKKAHLTQNFVSLRQMQKNKRQL